MFGIGGIEFIASQTPYSMRGLIMGTAYYMFMLCAAIGEGIRLSVPFTRQLSVGCPNAGYSELCCSWKSGQLW